MLRDISIKSVLNGWIVEVGCQTVVFTDLGHMMTQLRLYLEDPEEMEKEYLEKSVNSGKLGQDVQAVAWSGMRVDGDAESVPLSEMREGVECPPAYNLNPIG